MAKYSKPNRQKPNKTKRNLSSKKPKSTLTRVFLWIVYLGFIGSVGMVGFLFYLSQDLPSLDDLVDPKYDLPTQIYDRNNELVAEFYTKRRVLIPFKKVPDVLVKALLSTEDSRFYSHIGIDPIRIVSALAVDIAQGRFAQGASTLTQQTARNFLLTSDKKVTRKLKEILLALKMESRFSKNQILELYLNKTYFGHGAYGIEAAAQAYFSKNTEELNLAEAAMIAGLPQLPSRWAPTHSMENATKRRNLVLKMMENAGFISKEERIKTAVTPIQLNLNLGLGYNETSYYTEHVRRYLYNKFGKEQLYNNGLKVYTMMDLKKQISAQNTLHQGLIDHDRRQGYRGPIKNLLQEIDEELGLYVFDTERGWDEEKFKRLDEDSKTLADKLYNEKSQAIIAKNHLIIGGYVQGIVTKVNPRTVQVNLGQQQGKLLLNSMRWARPVNYDLQYTQERLNNFNDILLVGDVIKIEILDYDHINKEFTLVLTQEPIANGGLLAMDPLNGEIVAMSGGYDFRESEFNRAIQGKRQTGSAFKSIVYSLALESSYTTSSMLDDTPFVGEGESGYKPENDSRTFKGKMTFREALTNSKNVPSIRLTQELGTKAVIKHARKLGITADLPEDDLTIVLGTASLTLQEMVVTFGIFANGGRLVKPVFISRVEDRHGEIIEAYQPPEFEQVISEETAFLMTSILKDVVTRGTGWKAQAINRPSAGKTGSTNEYRDAWYLGYIPQLITGVYVGFDKSEQTLGHIETGSRAATPIWVDFMQQAVSAMPILPFKQPDGINMVKINIESGQLDCESGGKSRFEYYKAGTEPTQCHRIIATPFQEESRPPHETENGFETPLEEDLIEEL